MHKVATINTRIEPQLKAQAENILHKVGLTSAEAVRLFYTQICIHEGLPFDVKASPNKKTAKAIEEARNGEGIVKCKDVDDLFNQLGI